MTAKVLKFSGERAGEPVQSVVEMLEEWLEKAKAGGVRAVAVLAVMEGAELLTSRCENDHWAALLAAHEMSRHNMLMDAYNA